MGRLDELKLFAQEQEKLARDELVTVRENIRNKRITCNGVRDRYEVIKIENQDECNDEDKEIQDFTTNLNEILTFYDEQLINIDEAAEKLNSVLPFDLKNVRLDESKSLDYYETQIADCYDTVIRKFHQASRAIIRFCKILVDIANENLTEHYERFGNVYIVVNLLVKFILPLQKVSNILNECLEQVDIRDQIPTNPNDDDRREEACRQLKVYAQRLIAKDNKIKAAFSPLLEAITDGFGLSEEFGNSFYSCMNDYYQLNRTYGFIHLELCAYKMTPENQVSRGRISDYYDAVNGLRGKLQTEFSGAMDEISNVLRN